MRMNPRTFVADAAQRDVASLSELIDQLVRHPGLRRRDLQFGRVSPESARS